MLLIIVGYMMPVVGKNSDKMWYSHHFLLLIKNNKDDFDQVGEHH